MWVLDSRAKDTPIGLSLSSPALQEESMLPEIMQAIHWFMVAVP